MPKMQIMLILAVVMAILVSCSSDLSSPLHADQILADFINQETATPDPPNPTRQATAVPQKVQLTATVWQQAPQVPILMYHRFDPSAGASSYSYTTSLTDFDAHLSALYEAGFSLVSLTDWLAGAIHLPAGRRPLIITFDDLFYGDQFTLDEEGQPADYCGVGRAWQFYRTHPNFNFHLALFYNLGDKPYANTYTNGTFSVGEGWRQDRAAAIAWGIENGAIPMNHFYNHPFLNQLSPSEIAWELAENDRALREALALVGKETCAENLPNILALPYGNWPEYEQGNQVLFDYVSPEGEPVSAIIKASSTPNKMFFSSPFSPDYDPWHVPRINGSREAIDKILNRLDEIPAADQCELGIFDKDNPSQPDLIMAAIAARINAGDCTTGIYLVGEQAYQASSNGIIQLEHLPSN